MAIKKKPPTKKSLPEKIPLAKKPSSRKTATERMVKATLSQMSEVIASDPKPEQE